MSVNYNDLMDQHSDMLRTKYFDELGKVFKRLMISEDNADALKGIVYDMCMHSYNVGLDERRELRR